MADTQFVGESLDKDTIVSVNLSRVCFARSKGNELKIFFGGPETTPLILKDEAAVRYRGYLKMNPGQAKKKRAGGITQYES